MYIYKCSLCNLQIELCLQAILRTGVKSSVYRLWSSSHHIRSAHKLDENRGSKHRCWTCSWCSPDRQSDSGASNQVHIPWLRHWLWRVFNRGDSPMSWSSRLHYGADRQGLETAIAQHEDQAATLLLTGSAIFLYRSEAWTTRKTDSEKIQDFHVTSQRQILIIRWIDHVKNTAVTEKTGLNDLPLIIAVCSATSVDFHPYRRGLVPCNSHWCFYGRIRPKTPTWPTTSNVAQAGEEGPGASSRVVTMGRSLWRSLWP